MRTKSSVNIPRPKVPFHDIVADILELYPEARAIEVAGSWARNEMHTHSDVDILIRFPKRTNGFQMLIRDGWMEEGREMNLNLRWSCRIGVCVDFIIRVDGTTGPGQHRRRVEQGLPTPSIILWEKN